MIAIAEAANDPTCSTVVAVMGSQMSKTETAVNIIGRELDDDPAPMLYIAPTKSFCEKVFEPRLRSMLDTTPQLAAKKRAGKQESKTMKEVAGVKVRLAWAGSATEVAGDPAKYVFVDERDRMSSDVAGEGDIKILADERHATYPGGKTFVFSTPLEGQAEVEVDEATGLEFWKVPTDSETVQSPTWKLWLQGDRHHWAVPCPSCLEFFIPRFALLSWPEDATPEEATHEASLACARCGTLIGQEHKDEMHARGVMVAPGQRITTTGRVLGLVEKTDIRSFWISGLMSPWRTWGQRAAAFIRAYNDGDPEKIQAVINTNMGELYSVGGDRTHEDALKALKAPYEKGEVLEGVAKLTAFVDVAKDRLHYSVVGWGADLFSCRVDWSEVIGDTAQDEVWETLATLKDRHYGGLPIERMFIDSGYRASSVYKFCRKFRDWAYPTKGRDTIQSAPLSLTKIDILRKSGKKHRGGLAVYSINTDYFKRWLTDRFERDPDLPGGWFLPEDITDEYLAAMRSEVRIVSANNRPSWIVLDKNNHYWDCEVGNIACAYSLNLQMMTGEQVERERQRQTRKTQTAQAERIQPAPTPGGGGETFRQNQVTGGHFSGAGGGWFGRK